MSNEIRSQIAGRGSEMAGDPQPANGDLLPLRVLRAQSGDREALDALLRVIQEPLFGYLVRLMGDRASAEDVLQEVFLRICRKLRWLDDPRLFRPWVYRIASREAFRTLKRERRWREQLRDAEVLDAIAAPEAPPPSELPKLIERASPASRAVLILHYLHEMTLEEVADVLGIALGTVKSRLAYGLRTLRS